MTAISLRTFPVDFLEWKLLYFKQSCTELCSFGSNWQYGNIGSDNALAPNRRQAIIWTNVGMLFWCTYICVTRPQCVKSEGVVLNLQMPVPCRHALQWRHNERDGVSNHQPHHCFLNRLFRRRSKKTSKLRVTGLFEGNSPVTDGFPPPPHKEPVTRKMFPFDDVIMDAGKEATEANL